MKVNGKAVKKLLIEKNMSQEECAMKIKVSYGHFTQCTSGKRNMSWNTGLTLARVLGCSIKDLICEE
jgi:DNA-binding XRE family transcriptional regulator